MDRTPLRVGVIADTHGLLRPAALEALRGCDHIVHAGDVGGPAILEALAELAPLSTVRGNNDREPWAETLPERLRLELGGVSVYVLHDLKTLDFAPADQGIAVVISGHSHTPRQDRRDGVLYLNPGSAGPRRFRLPIALAHLVLGDGEPRVEPIDLAG